MFPRQIKYILNFTPYLCAVWLNLDNVVQISAVAQAVLRCSTVNSNINFTVWLVTEKIHNAFKYEVHLQMYTRLLDR